MDMRRYRNPSALITGHGWYLPVCNICQSRQGLPSCTAGLVDVALHLDKHLGALIAQHGTSTYAILFAIVFAETGLVGHRRCTLCGADYSMVSGSCLCSLPHS